MKILIVHYSGCRFHRRIGLPAVQRWCSSRLTLIILRRCLVLSDRWVFVHTHTHTHIYIAFVHASGEMCGDTILFLRECAYIILLISSVYEVKQTSILNWDDKHPMSFSFFIFIWLKSAPNCCFTQKINELYSILPNRLFSQFTCSMI